MAIKFEASGDFGQLLAENAKLQQALVRLTDQVTKLESANVSMSEGLGMASSKFAGAAKPAEAYSRTVRKLDAELALGKITQEQHTAAVAAAKEKLDQASTAGEKHAGGMSKLGGQVTSLAAGYVSWSGALKLAGDALKFVQEETNKAKASQDSLVDNRRSLVQIAENKEDLEGMIDRADAAAEKFGVARNTAYEVLFSARSEGFESEYEQVMSAAPVIAPKSAATVAGQVPGLFKETEQLTSEEAVSGTLLAAQQSRMNFEELGRAMPKAAEGAAIAKASFSETAGVLSVLAARFASGDTAADRIKAFATKLGISEQFGGKGIVGGYEALAAADEETRKEFLGSSNELNAVWQILSEELPTVKERIAAVNAELGTIREGGPSLVEKQTEISLSDPAEQARLGRVKAEIAREIANENQFAVGGNERMAASDRELARMKKAGESGLAQYAAQGAGSVGDFVGAEADDITRAQRVWSGFATGGVWGAARGAFASPQKSAVERETEENDRSFVTKVGAMEARGEQIPAWALKKIESDPILAEQLDEARKQRAATERQTEILERVADQLGRQPRSGASAAAAAPNGQRQGR